MLILEDIERMGRVPPGTPEWPLEGSDRRRTLCLPGRTRQLLENYALDLEQYFGFTEPVSLSGAVRVALSGTEEMLDENRWPADSLLTAIWQGA